MYFTNERYQWVPTPDGKLILIDSWTSRVVENAPVYKTSTSYTTTTSNTIDKERAQTNEEPKVHLL